MGKRFFRVLLILAILFVIGDTERLVKNKASAVVTVMTLDGHGGTGSYVRTAHNGIVVLTNNHICDHGPVLQIIEEGGATYITTVLKQYEDNDLCAISASPGRHPTISLARSVANYENIYAFGHPLLEPLTITTGSVAGTHTLEIPVNENGPCLRHYEHQVQPDPSTLQGVLMKAFGIQYICVAENNSNPITAAIQPGNSGSPVLNIWGHLVGVAFAAIEGGSRGYMVPLSDVKAFLGEL